MRARRSLFVIIVTGALVLLLMSWQSLVQLQPISFRLPRPISFHPYFPSPIKLLDLENFEYLINPAICGTQEPVLAVVLIHTHPANVQMRDIHRKAIGKDVLKEIELRRVFLMGEAVNDQANYPSVPADLVFSESAQHGDIVKGNFVEHYRNLTYKHVMGLTWVTQFCKQAHFVIKMDDDIAVDLFQIKQMIKYRYRNLKNEMLGLVEIDSPVIRSKDSKWRVALEEYAEKTYPMFLSGWCYIASMDSVHTIVSEVSNFRYFFIDDAFVTGIVAEKLGIKRMGLNNRYTTSTDQLRCCSDTSYGAGSFYCDYLAAPTGKNLNFMADALNQFYNCYRKGCQRRRGLNTVARSCVIKRNPNELPSGVGVGEVISL